MRRGRLLAARRAAVVVTLAFSLCTAGQAVSPSTAKARTQPAARISVGTTHACAVISGTAYCWGSNARGELGDGSTTNASAPVAVTGLTGMTMVEITAGQDFTCALDSAGAAYCWGDNGRGELGLGGPIDTSPHPPPVAVSGGHVFTTISAAAVGYHVCALDTAGRAWCWGQNTSGQLGCGTPGTGSCPSPSTAPVEVTISPGMTTPLTQIVTGNNSTCALDSAGHAWCWGSNTYGELGANPSPGTSSPVPVQVTTAANAPLSNLVQVTVGIGFGCAVDSAGASWCWGANGSGQLGIGSTVSTTVPTRVSQGVVPAGRTLAQISAGDTFACGLDSAGAAYCWGAAARGQTGLCYTPSYTPVAVYAALGPLPGCGSPPYPFAPQWPDPVLEGVTLTQISAGESFACAMDAASNVYCWGDNNVSVGMGGGIGAPPGFSPVPVQLVFPVAAVLSLTCQDSADLGEGTPGSTVSGSIGPCTVNDSRATGAGTWTVTVASTNYTYAGPPSYTIPASNATYTIPSASITGVTGTAPNNLASGGLTFAEITPPATVSAPVPVLTGAPPTNRVTWDPTLTIAIPPGAALTNEATPTDVYQGTITTSVTG